MLMFDVVALEKKGHPRWILWMLFRNEPIYLVRFRRPFWITLLLWTNFNTSRARMVRKKQISKKCLISYLIFYQKQGQRDAYGWPCLIHPYTESALYWIECELILPRQFCLPLWFATNYPRLVKYHWVSVRIQNYAMYLPIHALSSWN